MSEASKNSKEAQARFVASHDGRKASGPTGTADRFERPESYTATLQRQNAVLHDEVAELHGQVRELQLALVVEKALGVMNSRARGPAKPSPAMTVDPTKETS